MKSNTNIVLTGNKGRTQSYIVQLMQTPSTIHEFTFKKYVTNNETCGVLFEQSDNKQIIKNKNDWYNEIVSGTEYNLHSANIRLYFPQYSVDTYDKNVIYILSLSTYIHGNALNLGNFVIRRRDSLACPPTRFVGMDEYFEYMDFVIADPYSIHYGQECSDIREALGESGNINANGSLLYASLYVVEETSTGYILRNDWSSCQNSIFLSESKDLQLHMNYNADINALHMRLNYNNDQYESLSDYIYYTYHSDYTTIIWEYVIMDDTNIYYQASDMSYVTRQSFDESFDHSFGIAGGSDADTKIIGDIFHSWDDWKDGLYIRGSVSLAPDITQEEYENDDYVPFLVVFSNKIPINKELFGMLIRDGSYPLKIEFDDIDMNNVNLTAINRISNNVTVVSPTDSAKKHMIQPVFYQTREINNVIIHPAVTENIALNLDSYKGQVDRFKLQVEGIVFNEIGRTGKGIIFKVYGNMLPKSADNGVLYILNQNNDLVTTGKYSYVF